MKLGRAPAIKVICISEPIGLQNSFSLRQNKTQDVHKRILMLLNAPYPADIRVKKEADALIQGGFEVYLLCLRKKGQSTTEVFEGIRVHRIDAGKNNYQLAFWDVVMSLNFIHPKFLIAARKILKSEKIDFVHVHDLPLNGTALKLRQHFAIKVVADFHENYPEALKTWFKWKKNPIARLKNNLFMNSQRWTRFEKETCEKADAVIAVVDEMKHRLVSGYGTPPGKIRIVTNTEDKNFIRQQVDELIYGNLASKFILTYSGGIGPHRGVDVAIRGMKHLVHEKEIQLAVVGFGSPSVMNSLYALVAELQLTNVHFLGYQPFSKFYSYMKMASVNIIPHQSNGHTDNTVPHKLFQGMMAGKPLLVSSSAPLKRFVEKYNTGAVFEAGDPRSFADQALLLYNDKNLQARLGANGIKATMEGPLNWETTQTELISLYHSLS
jgi:glycosyltransferase involved in cell wall biosynthesis